MLPRSVSRLPSTRLERGGPKAKATAVRLRMEVVETGEDTVGVVGVQAVEEAALKARISR